MFKVFTLGIILGLLGSAGLLYAVPAVNLDRERSIISVQPNGGNRERFHVNIPGDRLMAGVSGKSRGFPGELSWPAIPGSAASQTEIFKVRNEEDRVVGVASRFAAGAESPFVEWVLHLPARGSAFLILDGKANEDGSRPGEFRGGTKEFRDRQGIAAERFVASAGTAGNEGRLELVTSLVGRSAAEPASTEETQ